MTMAPNTSQNGDHSEGPITEARVISVPTLADDRPMLAALRLNRPNSTSRDVVRASQNAYGELPENLIVLFSPL